MTTTLNPTIAITVPGPTGSGKSRVLALKLYHGDDIIIDSPKLASERRSMPKGYAHWHSPRSGTLFKLEETNHPINTGRCIATPITAEDLCDRPVPAHIQALMSKLGISFEEYRETSLQPVVDLVNWALMTPQIPESPGETITDKISEETPDTRCDNAGTKSAFSITSKEGVAIHKADSLIAEQLGQGGDWVTSRAGWEKFLADTDKTTLLKVLTFSLFSARTSGR